MEGKNVLMLPMLALLLLAIHPTVAPTAAISTSVCKSAIQVSGAGTNLVNGLYHADTAELSDGVLYYYKWVNELNDYLLLFRDADESNNNQMNWAIMSLKQIKDTKVYRDYYVVQSASATPPDSGWLGKPHDSTYSLGVDPMPNVRRRV